MSVIVKWRPDPGRTIRMIRLDVFDPFDGDTRQVTIGRVTLIIPHSVLADVTAHLTAMLAGGEDYAEVPVPPMQPKRGLDPIVERAGHEAVLDALDGIVDDAAG